MLGAELQLGLREDHPVGDAAAELRALERAAVRKQGAGKGDRDRRPGTEVPRPADDLARLGLADIDAAELEAVGVRVLARLDDLAHEVAAVVAVVVGHTAVGDALHLAGGDREAVGDRNSCRVNVDVLAEPGNGDLHVRTA